MIISLTVGHIRCDAHTNAFSMASASHHFFSGISGHSGSVVLKMTDSGLRGLVVSQIIIL